MNNIDKLLVGTAILSKSVKCVTCKNYRYKRVNVFWVSPLHNSCRIFTGKRDNVTNKKIYNWSDPIIKNLNGDCKDLSFNKRSIFCGYVGIFLALWNKPKLIIKLLKGVYKNDNDKTENV